MKVIIIIILLLLSGCQENVKQNISLAINLEDQIGSAVSVEIQPKEITEEIDNALQQIGLGDYKRSVINYIDQNIILYLYKEYNMAVTSEDKYFVEYNLEKKELKIICNLGSDSINYSVPKQIEDQYYFSGVGSINSETVTTFQIYRVENMGKVQIGESISSNVLLSDVLKPFEGGLIYVDTSYNEEDKKFCYGITKIESQQQYSLEKHCTNYEEDEINGIYIQSSLITTDHRYSYYFGTMGNLSHSYSNIHNSDYDEEIEINEGTEQFLSYIGENIIAYSYGSVSFKIYNSKESKVIEQYDYLSRSYSFKQYKEDKIIALSGSGEDSDRYFFMVIEAGDYNTLEIKKYVFYDNSYQYMNYCSNETGEIILTSNDGDRLYIVTGVDES